MLHLLHYTPERRGTDFDTIEDVLPVYNIQLSVKNNRKVNAVTLVPQNQNLSFQITGDRIEFTLKELNGHQMIAFS